MRVFIPVAKHLIRPTNTDLRYAARMLPRISEWEAEIEIVQQQSIRAALINNLRYAASAAISRGAGLPKEWRYTLNQDCPVYPADVQNCDAVLAYERYPENDYGLPVVWITGPTYEKCGYTDSEVQDVRQWKKDRAERAEQLVFMTDAARRDFLLQTNPKHADKSTVIPYFQPDLLGLDDFSKWEESELRLLFVGRQAKRKGLPFVLDGLLPILRANQNVTLTIVSTMADGMVEVPALSNVRHIPSLKHSAMLKAMRHSHIMLMPSLVESYGLAHIEAMSQGCIPLAMDRPAQREMFGGCGILIEKQEPELLRDAIQCVLDLPNSFAVRAKRGVNLFKRRYAPKVVASQFAEVLRGAVRRINLASALVWPARRL